MSKVFNVTSFATPDGYKLQYKGFVGTVEFDFEDNIIHGKVIAIITNIDGTTHTTKFTNLCTYEGRTIADLEKDFKDAVDNYLYEIKI